MVFCLGRRYGKGDNPDMQVMDSQGDHRGVPGTASRGQRGCRGQGHSTRHCRDHEQGCQHVRWAVGSLRQRALCRGLTLSEVFSEDSFATRWRMENGSIPKGQHLNCKILFSVKAYQQFLIVHPGFEFLA